MAVTAVYSATKAAVHSYVLSQRFMLRETGIRGLEIAPPWTRTELMNSEDAEAAMPLTSSSRRRSRCWERTRKEILVEAAKPARGNPGANEHGQVNGFNGQMMAIYASR